LKPIYPAALAVLFAVFIAGPAGAQKEPSEVTDGEITKYKATARTACTEAGTKRGDPKEKVEAFCSCVLDTLNESMTRAEWQQAYFYSLNNRAAEEEKVLSPHMGKLGRCRPK
jgi:hypothetical protein